MWWAAGLVATIVASVAIPATGASAARTADPAVDLTRPAGTAQGTGTAGTAGLLGTAQPAGTVGAADDIRGAGARGTSAAAVGERSTRRRRPPSAAPRGRLAVGDSLLVGAEPMLRPKGFKVHAQVGRQFAAAPAIVRTYSSRLPRNVVIELGTNGTVRLADCHAVVRAAGPKRVVFLVTNRVPRRWERTNNEVLRRCDRGHRASHVRIIDWHRASSGHPEWLASDGFHTTPRGRRALADLIATEVARHGR